MKPAPHATQAERGVTLLEMLVAVSLLSLLSAGILISLHTGLNGMSKVKTRLMDNRRLAGVHRIVEQQVAGFIPVVSVCVPGGDRPPVRLPFFQGEAQSMRFVSAYSLKEGWRGIPRILEFQVIPGEPGAGLRLVVNEHPYAGAGSAGIYCAGVRTDEATGAPVPVFRPIEISPQSFVLADRLAYCRFSFLERGRNPADDRWTPQWVLPRWPAAVRIEMAPVESDAVRLRPVTATIPVHVSAEPGRSYAP
ncbi:MAG: prepilin-type N-terminal cleavage/methylation domain-containing protein [Bryobacteraceae bacterium]